MNLLSDLQWRSGPFRRQLWAALLRYLAAITPRRAPGIRLRRSPDGTIIKPIGNGRGSGDGGTHPWQVQLEPGEEDKLFVRFERGLIGGVEPKIGDKRISEADEKTGDVPALTVKRDQFGDDGICRIYVKAAVARSWTIEKAEMIARKDTPAVTPWIDHTLIALLVRSEDDVVPSQRAYADFTWVATERRTSGLATYLKAARGG